MNRSRLAPIALLLAASSLGAQQNQTPAPPPAAPSSAVPGATPVVPERPHRGVIKLWQAKITEDVIKKMIESREVRFNLTSDDILELQAASVPQNLIMFMLDVDKNASMGVPSNAAMAPAPGTTPQAGGSAALVARATAPVPIASVQKAWQGMARRNGGLVVFKSRWDVGALEFKEETIFWKDAKDPKKNVFVPMMQVAEQFIVEEKKGGGNVPFEWGFRSKSGDEYRFRDQGWQKGDNTSVKEIFKLLKDGYPALVSSTQAADEK